jgi:hypothetical protein
MTAARTAAIDRISERLYGTGAFGYERARTTLVADALTVADCIALDPTGRLAELVDAVADWMLPDPDSDVSHALMDAYTALLADPSMQEPADG